VPLKIVSILFRFLAKTSRHRWNLDELQAKAKKSLGDYHDGMRILLQNPKVLFKPMLLSFLAWGFEVLTLIFVFASLNQLISPEKVIIDRSIAGNVEASLHLQDIPKSSQANLQSTGCLYHWCLSSMRHSNLL
jgi:uncharacterized membrane protein YbhN (UPF0104 family)